MDRRNISIFIVLYHQKTDVLHEYPRKLTIFLSFSLLSLSYWWLELLRREPVPLTSSQSEHYHWQIRSVSGCVLLQPCCVSACPRNYGYLRCVFSTTLSNTHPALPPLCQPGNPGCQVTKLSHIPSPTLLPFLSELLVNCIPMVHWISILLGVFPMLPASLT